MLKLELVDSSFHGLGHVLGRVGIDDQYAGHAGEWRFVVHYAVQKVRHLNSELQEQDYGENKPMKIA